MTSSMNISTCVCEKHLLRAYFHLVKMHKNDQKCELKNGRVGNISQVAHKTFDSFIF